MKYQSPMLAATADPDKIRFPVLASYKYDGVRATVEKGVLMSRNGKPIPNLHCQKLFARAKMVGLDGELIVGNPTAKDVFQRTMSGVMSVDGVPDVQFYVFDLRYNDTKFAYRLSTVTRLFSECVSVRVVPHTPIHNQEELDAFEAYALASGYEGVMLRDICGKYKYGRSTVKEGGLLRVKRFVDSEAMILGCVEEMENANEQTTDELGRSKRSTHKAGKRPKGVLGSFHVRDLKTGVDFHVGAGITEAQAAGWWRMRGGLMGRIIKYKYQPVGVKDRPRLPVFLGFRDPIDL